MATIGKIKVGDTTHDIAGSIQYIKPTVKSAGSSTSGAYAAAKWAVNNINGSTTLTEGMTIAVRTPGAGTKGGVLLSIDGGTTYKPLARNANTIITTHYAANSTLILTYNSTAAVENVYATSNTKSTITGCWQIADYDSNTTYAAATTSKAGLMSTTDKSHLDSIWNIWSADGTGDTLVNKVEEVIAIFQDYPEGDTIVNALASKVTAEQVEDIVQDILQASVYNGETEDVQ